MKATYLLSKLEIFLGFSFIDFRACNAAMDGGDG